MVRAVTLSTVLLTLSFLLTGCLDYHEIDDLAIVLLTGLDAEENGHIKITSQVAIPQALSGIQSTQGDSTDGFIVYSEEGKNINVAMQFMQQKMSRTLFYDHRRVLLIGEELAKRGLEDVFDHFTRNPSSRMQTYILIAKNSKAQDLLNTSVPFETNPGQALRNLIHTDLSISTTLQDLINELADEGIDSVVGAIELVPSFKTGSGGLDMMTFQFAGAAVLKDYKLIDYLDKPNTRNLLWVRNEIEGGYMTGHVPGAGEVSMEIIKADSSLETVLKDNQIKINITAKASGPIYENNTNLDLGNPKNVNKAEEALNEILEQRLRIVIDTAQNQLRSDIFGIGREIHRNHPKYWQKIKDNWNDIFPNIEIQVNSNVTVTNTGMYGPPLHLKENEIED
ncbi:hypothetical protein BKP37_15245 [Anaerobacillus alkalilacustris]|uniref:Uncharacterized protein n=1 Tax=Anaerobacillus alkalilacustris TaxID=393763 RepID=A0A1S2LGX3_9BACI|nr:Ger(x)C family spore germination protein [Anaerobacillus alkalilacustris]OIJ11792.1 hypothetical protein BKP37_15245 [Anaerobacillus alkalilacustris]